MLTFPRFIFAITALATAMALPLTAVAGQHADVQTMETQAALTPEKALALLKAGNERFLSGNMKSRDLAAQVKATAGGQFPHSIVLGCVDSRVPPELVFDQGIGDIFAPRVAGNFADEELLGSMEFAAAVAGSKLIVVLGHTECGAVKGACDDVQLGNLTQTLSHIMPAVEAVPGFEGERNSGNKDFVNAVTHENVRLTVTRILQKSLVLSELVKREQLLVIGAIYDVSTGKVTFIED